ncbi:MAG: ABC transporter substrate-binding protein [Bacteroidetes bacterium]|nr:ABC transporter substrate-binding protein [Bacteroidota bacterium]
MIRIALPDAPFADPFVAALGIGPERLRPEVVRLPAHETADALRRGDVDVALVPSLAVLRDPTAFAVLPSAALSMWDFPFVRLVLGSGVGAGIETVVFDPRDQQAVVLTALILREHYGATPAFRPIETPSLGDLDEADAVLMAGPDVPVLDVGDRYAMDLGQEYYELVNYPLVWGLFVARSGAATPEQLRLVKAGAATAEASRAGYVAAQERSEALRAFYAESLRFRLDDLATASLTELADLLFEAGILDEVPTLPVAAFKDEDVEDGEQPPEA